jgi:hypothetical protein
MTELSAYKHMIDGASSNLRDAIASIADEDFDKRPVSNANPVSFIYFHVLRHWDRDINIYCKMEYPERDAWHRHGLSEAFGYEPLGRGTEGIGTGYGYSDAEVDALPLDAAGLRRYHEILIAETESFLAGLDPATLDDAKDYEGRRFTTGQRLRHLVAHTYLHLGDIEYAKGLLGAPAGDFPTLS